MKNISIIIPTADRQERVLSLLEKLKEQTLPPKEIIIVDNGINPVKMHEPSYKITVVRTPQFRIGPSRARNIGAKSASWDYLAFIDDDDLWEPNYLEMVMQCFQKTRADAVVGQLMRKNQNSQTIENYKQFPNKLQDQRKVFYSNPGFGGSNLVIKRQVFLNLNGFDETMPASEDRDLLVRLILSHKKIISQPAAKAICQDHDGIRSRDNIIKGNLLFIKKHWHNMYLSELYKATKTVIKRWLGYKKLY